MARNPARAEYRRSARIGTRRRHFEALLREDGDAPHLPASTAISVTETTTNDELAAPAERNIESTQDVLMAESGNPEGIHYRQPNLNEMQRRQAQTMLRAYNARALDGGIDTAAFATDHVTTNESPATREGTIDELRQPYYCVVCESEENREAMLKLSCNHLYCPACLLERFELALRDATFYPIRCCEAKPIPLSSAQAYLPATFYRKFSERMPELECKDRTYCHVTWITCNYPNTCRAR